MKKTISALLLMIFTTISSLCAQNIKVAAVGDSVTFGLGIDSASIYSYPAVLQQLLGESYEVRNFGKSGSTLLAKGHRPYVAQQEYQDALAFAADKVIIHLGLNDTDPRNWPNYRDEFESNYSALIRSFREANPQCEIWICRMTPISSRHPRFKSGTRDWYWQIQSAIEAVAEHEGVGIIDLQKVLYSHPEMLPDGLHPNARGATLIAKEVYSTMTGDFGGLTMSNIYSDNMVLQRGKSLTISGTDNAHETITLSIDKQKVTTKATSDGSWKVTLKPLTEGKVLSMSVKSGSGSLEFNNILVGEVWLCSGQSNMEFELAHSVGGEAELSTIAENPNSNIRIYNMQEKWRTDNVQWQPNALDSLNKHHHYYSSTWQELSSSNAAPFSAVAYYFGKQLSESLGVPVGLIANAVGGAPLEAWIDRRTLEFELPDILNNWTNNDMIQEWVRGRARFNTSLGKDPLQRHPYEPAYLYEVGIAPLADYTIAGMLWYQGESNAHNTELHSVLFPLFVSSMRSVWGESLPILTVQLSSLNRPSWCVFRDSQRVLAKSIEGVQMVVSTDVGDLVDVHPRNKKPVGQRLALQALANNYGMDICASGPSYLSCTAKGSTLVVEFTNAEGMTSSDGDELRTFEIAEIDGFYYPATAKIKGNTIHLKSKNVAKPRYVRYAWQPYTTANLINNSKLPASTFKGEATK